MATRSAIDIMSSSSTLVLVLYGALGKNNNTLEKSVDSFKKWYFAHQNKNEPCKLDEMDIEQELADNITFATFEEDKI